MNFTICTSKQYSYRQVFKYYEKKSIKLLLKIDDDCYWEIIDDSLKNNLKRNLAFYDILTAFIYWMVIKKFLFVDFLIRGKKYKIKYA